MVFFCLLLVFSTNSHFVTEMSDSSKQDVFIEVRKRGSSNSKIEKENFDTLKAIEESIQSKSKGELTPVKYFNALMTMLNTNTAYYRSVFCNGYSVKY